jgi:hypothetical protein
MQQKLMLRMGLLLMGILGLFCLSASIFKQQNQALAQQGTTTNLATLGLH